ncbi:MAG: hypothetical protein ABI462_04085 [Ignavibacteria bacterium]
MDKKYFPYGREGVLSASDFVSLYEQNPDRIESSTIIPPESGRSEFGKIFVKLSPEVNERSPEVPKLNGKLSKSCQPGKN